MLLTRARRDGVFGARDETRTLLLGQLLKTSYEYLSTNAHYSHTYCFLLTTHSLRLTPYDKLLTPTHRYSLSTWPNV